MRAGPEPVRLLHPGADLLKTPLLIAELSTAVAAVTGEAYLQALVVQLARALGVAFAVVAVVEAEGEQRARTLALCTDGALGQNFTFDLGGSPCRDLLGGEVSSVPSGLRATCPEFELSRWAQADSFCGVPLPCEAEDRRAVLFVADRAPLKDPDFAVSVLGTFAQRTAAEIDRLDASDALRDSEARHRMIIDGAPLCIQEVDRDGRILSINPTGVRAHNQADASDLVGQSFSELVAPWDRDRVSAHFARGFRGQAAEFEFAMRVGDEPRIFAATVVPLGAPSGEVEKLLCYALDITERKHAEARLVYLAEHDGLTGLPNRGLFSDRLHSGIARAKRNDQLLALLFVDLDDFKCVNDEFGHQMGDRVLRSVAKRLEGTVREVDTVARIGGDEFAIILEALADAEDATRVAAKIGQSLTEPFRVDDLEVVVGASTGIAFYPQDGDVPERLLRQADTEMYRVKRSGTRG